MRKCTHVQSSRYRKTSGSVIRKGSGARSSPSYVRLLPWPPHNIRNFYYSSPLAPQPLVGFWPPVASRYLATTMRLYSVCRWQGRKRLKGKVMLAVEHISTVAVEGPSW